MTDEVDKMSAASRGSVANGWISVTERLPPDNVDVLVRRSTIVGMRTVVAYRCQGNDCWTLNDGDYDDFYDWSVTHWMPLPAPPSDGK
jgi:hypothetical protein